MTLTPYYFMISQGPHSLVRAWLNDVPFYRFYGDDPVNRAGPAIHLLVPGENTFAIEIDRAPPESQVFFELLIDWDHESPVVYFEWPREAKHLPHEQRTPFRFETRFTPPGEIFSPAFLRASREEVPCEGTPDLREAVRRFHAAVETRDLDGFCEGLAWKARENERAYPDWPDSSASDMRADMAGFFREDLRVRPLSLDEVHFEPRADGRLVHATHLGGGFLIDAISMDKTPDGETARVSMDLTLSRIDGEWRILF
jgi:hypothetical protein